jgi:hypothetical protein
MLASEKRFTQASSGSSPARDYFRFLSLKNVFCFRGCRNLENFLQRSEIKELLVILVFHCPFFPLNRSSFGCLERKSLLHDVRITRREIYIIAVLPKMLARGCRRWKQKGLRCLCRYFQSERKPSERLLVTQCLVIIFPCLVKMFRSINLTCHIVDVE